MFSKKDVARDFVNVTNTLGTNALNVIGGCVIDVLRTEIVVFLTNANRILPALVLSCFLWFA